MAFGYFNVFEEIWFLFHYLFYIKVIRLNSFNINLVFEYILSLCKIYLFGNT